MSRLDAVNDTLRSTDAKPRAVTSSLGLCRGAKEEDRRSTAVRPAEEAAVRPSVTSALADKEQQKASAFASRRQTERHQACLNDRGAKEEKHSLKPFV